MRTSMTPSLLRAVAVLGVLASLLALVVGWTALRQLEQTIGDSLTLTADAIAGLDASADLARETVVLLQSSVGDLERAAGDLEASLSDGEVLLDDTADLARDDIAAAVQAIDDAMPGLLRAGATIDATLNALGSLPLIQPYDPEQSLAQALGGLDQAVSGLPEQLREQADLLESAAANLGNAGQTTAGLVERLEDFQGTLASSTALLDTYTATISQAEELVGESTDRLRTQLLLARIALVAVLLAFAAGQVIPWHLAALAEDAAGRGGDTGSPPIP